MEWPSIWIGAIFWHEIEDKASWVKEIEKIINEKIDLNHYGSGLQSIRFVYLALQPENRVHEEQIKYSFKKKQITLHLKLNFESVVQADKETFLRMTALLFLNSIERYFSVRLKNFDSHRFKKDVSQLFEVKGLLHPAERN